MPRWPSAGWAGLITLALGGLVAAFILHPFTPEMPQSGIDASWIAVMTEAADRPARWGVDLAFTYGPATPLVVTSYNTAYVSHTLPLLLAFALLFGWCAALLVARDDRPPRQILAGAAACAFAVIAAKGTPDAFYLTLPLLIFLVAMPAARGASARGAGARRVAAVLGGFAMGLTAMAKMSFPLAALPLFLLADAVAVARRRVPLLLMPFALGVVAGDLLYGQRLADLPAYVALQGEVVAGYAAGMALKGPIWDLAAFLLLAAALVAVALMAAWRDARRPADPWVVVLGLAVDLFFLFKAGFIRHDLHSLIAWRGLVVVGLVLAWGWLLPRHRRAALGVTAAAAVVALVYVPFYAVRQSGERPRGAAFARFYGGWLTDGPPEQVSAALAFLRDPAAFRADLDARQARAWADIAAAEPLGAIPGTVDMLPSDQSRLLAAGLAYDPRPSIQEYSTYTAGLAKANRAFLEGPRAPDWFLFGPESGLGFMTLDGRYPSLAEDLLWPDLLRLYRPDHRIGSLVALRRRDRPAPLPMGPRRAVVAGFDTFVPLGGDPTAAVWATIDIRPNLFGRVASLLFRPPLPGLAVRLENGEVRRFRFVPALGRAGFLLSPLVSNASDYAVLAEGRGAGPDRRVAAVSVEASRAVAAFYDPEVLVAFRALDTSGLRDGAPAPPTSGSAWERLVRARVGGAPDSDGRVAASAPSMLALPVEGLRHVSLGYGIDDGAWRDAHNAGVCFAIRPADGTGATLWRACLDPLDRAADRGSHAVSLDLPQRLTELALETTCPGTCDGGWAYWSSPERVAAGPGTD